MNLLYAAKMLITYYTNIALCIFVVYVAIMIGLYGSVSVFTNKAGFIKFILYAILTSILWLPIFIVSFIADLIRK